MKSVLISIQPYWVFLIIAKAMGWNIEKEKTVEVRKNYPKAETWDKTAKIYCSKDKKSFAQIPKEYQPLMQPFLGKVIGEFVCDCIANYEAELWDDETFESIREFYEPDDFAEYGEYEYKTIADNSDDFWKENMLCKASCLTIEELREYVGKGFAEFYGWGISDLVIYDKPKELSEFKKPCNKKCDKCDYLDVQEIGAYEHTKEIKTCLNFITRPPQSWCYVERSEG